MKPITFAAGLALALALSPLYAATERGPLRKPVVQADAGARVIVRFKSGSGMERVLAAAATGRPARAQALSQRLGVSLADGPAIDRRTQVLRAYGMSSTALAARLAADADVEAVHVDRRQRAFAAPSDPLYAAGQGTPMPEVGQWYLRAPEGEVKSAIDIERAWTLTPGNSSLVVAVIDTGVRPEHPDLVGKLLPGYDFVDDEPTANDGDGRDSDPSDPGDWITAAENLKAGGTFEDCGESPSSWHGTQTAGLVGAATDNGIGIAGAGRDVRVLPVRALGKCGGYVSDIVAAMRWAGGLSVPGVPDNANPARVINLSLGSANTCDASYQEAVDELRAAGVVIVAAAGNEAGLAVTQPANCSGVVGVGGLRHVGSKVGYSNVGPEVVLSAPAGNCVNIADDEPCLYPLVTTTNDGAFGPGDSAYSDSFNYSVGTSFASPLVAATVGLMLSKHPALAPDDVTTLLQKTVRAFPRTGGSDGIGVCQAPSETEQEECYCSTSTCGAGMLNAGAAVNAATKAFAKFEIEGDDEVTSGQTLTVDASGSTAAVGLEVETYFWEISDGGDIASITGSVDAATTTIETSGVGRFTLALTVTDSDGNQTTTSSVIEVASASDSGGGGGGAMSLGWLLALVAAAVALRWINARRKA